MSDTMEKETRTRLASPRRKNQTELQRELADKITNYTALDQIRILLACGAMPNEPVVQGLTPLHYACYANYVECVQLLLVRGCEVSATDDIGYSPLHLSAEHGNSDLVRLLIQHSAKVSFLKQPESELFPRAYRCEEPLRLALKNGHYDCARILLENGADPDTRYFLGSEISLLSTTDVKFLELLLIFGANPNVYDRDGLTPLMKSCRHRDGFAAAVLLLENGAYINALALQRQDLRTPLHYSILNGNRSLVKMLLENGARVNMRDDYDKPSPLDLSVLRDDPLILKMLLEKGGDPNVAHTYIGTPLHLACCSELEHEEEIIYLLLKHGANPSFCPQFEEGRLKSPIVEYLRKENPKLKIIQLFLAYGGEIVMDSPLNNPNGMLRSLLKIYQDQSLFALLLEAGQDHNLQAIDRLPLPIRPRLRLRSVASNPPSLQHLARKTIRSSMAASRLPTTVTSLPLPRSLHNYLLFSY